MEVLQTDKYYILNKGQHSLWFDRRTGKHEYKTCWDLANAQNPTCLGTVHAMLGKIQIHSELAPRIALVTGVREVGAPVFGGGAGPSTRVFGIKGVTFLPLNTQPLDSATTAALALNPCPKHNSLNSGPERRMGGMPDPRAGLSKTFGTLRSVTSSLRTATANVAANATGQVNKSRKEDRDRDRYERRILDELLKMFNNESSEAGESFYYCNDGVDLTSSLQRQSDPDYDLKQPAWRRADDTFFWNKNMMADFMEGGEVSTAASPAGAAATGGAAVWVVPVIQGFVQIEAVPLDTPDTNTDAHNAQPGDYYTVCLISRRSRHRAGTRYRRRGVDEEGHVANYVQSEQIVVLNTHVIAFVQVRGSVPVYWSQPGFKYRPPPRLDRGPEETQNAFAKHFSDEVARYQHVNCISLVETVGKEKVISDAFTQHILKLNSPNLTYVTFDFHEYCRGLRYENVSVLVEGLTEVLQSAGYCWVDKQGVICRQTAVCRTNCIDCLDRTNVVQTAIGRAVLERQFVKLGLLSPDQPLPGLCRSALNTMWANNGDTLSRQYAGTQALKGDFTRTGERKFSSLMKDGMNSANRYYLNRFKDAYRQATIDHMLGNPQSSDLLHLDLEGGPPGNGGSRAPAEEDEEEANAVAQHVKSVIDDATKLLVPDVHTILGAWGLIDADPYTGDPDQVDMDTILVLTRDSYYLAQYDEAMDRIDQYQRVSLIDLDAIQVGPYSFPSVFKQSRVHQCLRLCYQVDKQSGYFHTLRSMNIRFFNNLAVTITTEEERVESIKAIADTFEIGVQLMGCEAPMQLLPRLEKRRSKGRSAQLLNPLALFSQPLASLGKPSPVAFKSAGSRAFNNVTSGLARLNPISSFRRNRGPAEEHDTTPTFYDQKPVVSIEYLNDDSADLEDDEPTGYGYPEIHMASCGILASSVTTQAHHHGSSPLPPLPSSPLTRSLSEGYIVASRSSSWRRRQQAGVAVTPPLSPLHPTNRSLTPEIFVSECLEGHLRRGDGPYSSLPTGGGPSHQLQQLTTPLVSQRVRKLSHSSDEVDHHPPRDSGISASLICTGAGGNPSKDLGGGVGGTSPSAILRASSATDLQLHLASSRSESVLQRPIAAYSNPVSPLAAFQKDGVFGAPLSALAKGMQSLAPGAGKLARGMQNIGANVVDPRKLKQQRQMLADEDPVWKAKKAECRTTIIDF